MENQSICSLLGFYGDPLFPKGQPYENNLAVFQLLRDEYGLLGCVGMMCGGTDLMAFQGIPFASITFVKNDDHKPSARMQAMASYFPNFHNVVISGTEYNATNADALLPKHSIKNIQDKIDKWLLKGT